MRMELPRDVNRIIETLEEAGYEAYAVGGCVRDSLLGREPDDWDITTSAHPEEVKSLFRRTVDTGIQHGTVTVLLGSKGYEVTTYRIDGEYEDGRHPSGVTFTPELREDLRRRDFTINAMAYNEKKGLVDVFGGVEDLDRRIIRCVGEARERFTEDALRMMRAVRFSAQLGYSIEPATAQAIRGLASTLSVISAERVRTELLKLAVSPHPELLKLAWENGITAVILPEFDRCMETPQNNPHHCLNVGEHLLRSMQACEPAPALRLALLLHDIGKPLTRTADERGVDHFYGHAARSAELARAILRRLKFDNRTVHTVTELVKYHDMEVEPSPYGVRRAVHRAGEEIFPLLFPIKEADIAAQSVFRKEEKLQKLEDIRAIYCQVTAARDCLSLKELALSGKDLISGGMAPGPDIGRTLDGLLEWVLEHPEDNHKETLLKLSFPENQTE